MNERFCSWLCRNLADCVQVRNQYTKIKEDIADCRRLMETWRMPSLPDEDKGALSAELAKLESRRENLKKSLDEKISRLAESNSWPISTRTEVEDGEVAKYEEMVKYIEELKNTATEMNRVLNDIREPNPSGEHEHDTPMDVDVLADSVRPLKRRRLSVPGQQHQQRIAPEEVDAFQNNLLNLEERFANFENDLTEHNQELMQEVTAYVEGKVEEIAAAVKDVSASETTDLYDKADQEIKRMGSEVVELAEEMGALLLRANAQETETAKLQLEIEESKKQYISVGRQHVRILGFFNSISKPSARTAIPGLCERPRERPQHDRSPQGCPRGTCRAPTLSSSFATYRNTGAHVQAH